MQRQRALADAAFARAHGHEMAHTREPVGDAGALLGNLLEDSRPSVADDVVVTLHLLNREASPRRPPYTSLDRRGPLHPGWLAPLRGRARAAPFRSHARGDRCTPAG